ncbi:MAG: major facilitator family transporter [Planctomycetota bacterium]|jgi:MFS family permease
MKPATGAVVALTALNLLNYLDRFVVAGMVEPLKKAFGADDADIGLLTSVFLVVYMLASPVFGVMARSLRRTAILGAGVIVWSLATVAAGFAGGFGHLLLSRAIIGVGEAAYATVGPSILGDWFPPERRSAVLAVFYAAIPVGSAMGFLVGGLVSESLGWRAAFWIAGGPGLLLGVWCFRLMEPARGAMDGPSSVAGASAGPSDEARLATSPPTATATQSRRSEALWSLATNAQWMWCVLGYTAYTFSLGALAVWMPAFMQRERGWSPESAAITFSGIVVVTGFLGTIVGGAVDARTARGRAAPSLFLCAVTALVAAPLLMVAIGTQDRTTCIAATGLGCFLAFVSQAPINAAILNSVGSGARAFAVGMSTFVIHVLGDVPSPWLVGRVSDATGSLSKGLGLVPMGFAAAALIWGAGALALRRRPA